MHTTSRGRKFAGCTPYNALDRIADRKPDWPRLPGYARFCSYAGPITWDTLFLALRDGKPYRAGDAGRYRDRPYMRPWIAQEPTDHD